MKVVVAGASGFVGQGFLGRRFLPNHLNSSFIGLTRGKKPVEMSLEWRSADLLNLSELREAVRGADSALYLVHSMAPQAKLSQGKFQDFDLFQADNFARACAEAKIGHIAYLGGLIPEALGEEDLSDHLRSRLEVERALGNYGAKVTVLRAGLILGSAGSSSEILLRLVRRLPFMIAPKWTLSLTEAVDLDDVVVALYAVLENETLQGKVWDLGCGESSSYALLIQKAAGILGVKRPILPAPFFSPGLSKLWVRLITGAPRALVYPLVDSLRHSMLPRPTHRLFPVIHHIPRLLTESLRLLTISPSVLPRAYRGAVVKAKTVHSIQRLQLSAKSLFLKSPEKVGSTYFQWLPELFFGLLRVAEVIDSHSVKKLYEIHFIFWRKAILILEQDSEMHFKVRGGMLASKIDQKGELEFRAIPAFDCVLCSLQNFVPSLPWGVYRYTQALIHLWVVKKFEEELLEE